MKDDNPLTREFEWKEVPRKDVRTAIIDNFHTSGHPGTFKTYKLLSRYYYWPRMFIDVKRAIKSCQTCKMFKPSNLPPAGLMRNSKKFDRPAKGYSLDLVGPLPKSSNGYTQVLSIVDIFTKYCWLFALRRATAQEIVKILENKVFLTDGVPQIIVSDNGHQFTSNLFKDLVASYGVRRIFYTTLYTPMCNNVETFNRSIGYTLATFTSKNQRKWDVYLDQVQSMMNNTINVATGYTPNLLMKGREVILDGAIYGEVDETQLLNSKNLARDRKLYKEKMENLNLLYNIVVDNLWAAYRRNAKYYNKGRSDRSYGEGEIVWRRNFVQSNAGNYFTKKFAPRFVKSRIIRKFSDVAYLLRDEETGVENKYHIKDMVKSE
jgi:hypothetical protein